MKRQSLGVSDEKWHSLSWWDWQVIRLSCRSGGLESNPDPHLYPHRSSSSPTRFTSPCARVLFLTRVNNVLRLPGLCFSLFLLFYWVCRSGNKAQDIKHDRGNPSPFVHNSGRNKISILGCCAGDWTPSLTLSKVQKCFNLCFFQVGFFLPSSI